MTVRPSSTLKENKENRRREKKKNSRLKPLFHRGKGAGENMGDSNLSASELRKRYHQGGSIADSELSAAALRARYAIPSNDKDFSTRHSGSDGSSMAIIVVLAVLAFVGILFYMTQK